MILETGAIASHFKLLGLDGKEYGVPQDLNREPAVLAFIKTTCEACDLAIPYLNRLRQDYPDGWRLWAIVQDPPERARQYASEHSAEFPILIDAPEYEASRLYDPPATPTLFVVGPDGRVAYSTHGFAKDDLNKVATMIADYTGQTARIIAPEGDGRPDFRPG